MDPNSDMLTRIRNAQAVGHENVLAPFSKVKFALAKILAQQEFVKQAEQIKFQKKNFIKIVLKYDKHGQGAITVLKKISKPGQRIYIKHQDIRPVRQGFGIRIISTSKGLMIGMEARKRGLGGEIVCEVW